MAILHVKTPNGTTKTVDLETMNITSSLQQNGWCKLPNGLIIQWGFTIKPITNQTWVNNPFPLAYTTTYSVVGICRWRFYVFEFDPGNLNEFHVACGYLDPDNERYKGREDINAFFIAVGF